jgi:hypothetical protein
VRRREWVVACIIQCVFSGFYECVMASRASNYDEDAKTCQQRACIVFSLPPHPEVPSLAAVTHGGWLPLTSPQLWVGERNQTTAPLLLSFLLLVSGIRTVAPNPRRPSRSPTFPKIVCAHAAVLCCAPHTQHHTLPCVARQRRHPSSAPVTFTCSDPSPGSLLRDRCEPVRTPTPT